MNVAIYVNVSLEDWNGACSQFSQCQLGKKEQGKENGGTVSYGSPEALCLLNPSIPPDRMSLFNDYRQKSRSLISSVPAHIDRSWQWQENMTTTSREDKQNQTIFKGDTTVQMGILVHNDDAHTSRLSPSQQASFYKNVPWQVRSRYMHWSRTCHIDNKRKGRDVEGQSVTTLKTKSPRRKTEGKKRRQEQRERVKRRDEVPTASSDSQLKSMLE